MIHTLQNCRNYWAKILKLATFDTLESGPVIVLCQLVPAFPERWGINDSTIVNAVNPMIKELAIELQLPCIDMYTPFADKAELFPDRIHPNEEGTEIMAKIIYETLLAKKE
ncbi:MAG: hypothetical protein JXA77_02675 [Bacteroidales bacterium]|nr:hypothetical protein [Bacteroidales bacterium]MBN2817845.1 hypothetical protein [Bacteroidales bacterium]